MLDMKRSAILVVGLWSWSLHHRRHFPWGCVPAAALNDAGARLRHRPAFGARRSGCRTAGGLIIPGARRSRWRRSHGIRCSVSSGAAAVPAGARVSGRKDASGRRKKRTKLFEEDTRPVRPSPVCPSKPAPARRSCRPPRAAIAAQLPPRSPEPPPQDTAATKGTRSARGAAAQPCAPSRSRDHRGPDQRAVVTSSVVPAPGVKVGRIVAIDDLAIKMRTASVRVAGSGKGAVGGVPNPTARMVTLRGSSRLRWERSRDLRLPWSRLKDVRS
jgi:hypothetical protein